jgi:threonine dehydrogenase-like Zn-dependent dehydrogenase
VEAFLWQIKSQFSVVVTWVWAVVASSSRGARTICIDVDDGKLELARLAGGSHTIHSLRKPLHDSLLTVTERRGPDVLIEAVGMPPTFEAVSKKSHSSSGSCISAM